MKQEIPADDVAPQKKTYKFNNVMEGGRKDFDGPLDLLLFLIKRNEINLYDIPIADITDQYLDYIRFAKDFDIDEMADFHLMAATLLYIKSKMLLPVQFNEDDEIEDPREELVERLIEYQKYKKLSVLMEEKEREAEWSVERQKLERTLPFESESMWKKMDIWELLKTFNTLTKHLDQERIMDLFDEVSINEKITLLNELLEKKGECTFLDIISSRGSIMDIVCAFLAVLEALKLRMINAYQNKLFGDIVLRPREQNEAVSTEKIEMSINSDFV
jgi:segregation and condensation protein A